MNVLLSKDEGGKFRVRVMAHEATHNHYIRASAVRYYHETRGVTAPEMRSVVDTLRKGKCAHRSRLVQG